MQNTEKAVDTSLIYFGAEASQMLNKANVPLYGPRLFALAHDLRALADELEPTYGFDLPSNDELARDASYELARRIGGLHNLRSYTDCLLAKTNRV